MWAPRSIDALCWRCPEDLVNSVPSDFLVKRTCEALDSSLSFPSSECDALEGICQLDIKI